MQVFGSKLFGQMLGFAPVERDPEMLKNRKAYRIVVASRTWADMAEITQATAASMIENIDEPSELSLEVSMDDPYADLLDRPNTIKVYDRDGSLRDSFVIWGLDTAYDEEGGRYRVVDCLSLSSWLGTARSAADVVLEGTVEIIVANILNFQAELEPRILLGHITYRVRYLTRKIEVTSGTSALEALESLREIVGGHYIVDGNGVLSWSLSMTSGRGQEFSQSRNLPTVHRSNEYSEVVTRLWYFGRQIEGSERRITLVDAGEPQAYIDAPSAYVTKHGMIVQHVRDDSCGDGTTLLAKAQAYLEKHQDGVPSYSGEVVDYSQSYEYGFDSALSIEKGANVGLYHEDIVGGRADLDIVRVTRDLLNADGVGADFGNIDANLASWLIVRVDTGGGSAGTSGGSSGSAGADDEVLRLTDDEEPASLTGTAIIGTSDFASPADHAHPFDDAMFDWILDEVTDSIWDLDANALDFVDAIAAFLDDIEIGGIDGLGDTLTALQDTIDALTSDFDALTSDVVALQAGGTGTPGDIVPEVEMDGDAGSSSDYMRADAVPQGMPVRRANNRFALERGEGGTLEPGQICTTEDNRVYFVTSGLLLVPITHWEDVSS